MWSKASHQYITLRYQGISFAAVPSARPRRHGREPTQSDCPQGPALSRRGPLRSRPRRRRCRHGGRAGRDVRLPGPGAAAAGAARPARPHPAARGAAQPQQHAGGRAGSVLRGERGSRGRALGTALPAPAPRSPQRGASLPLPQACFASLVSQDYVNGTDQEEIRTGEPFPSRGAGAGKKPSGNAGLWGKGAVCHGS